MFNYSTKRSTRFIYKSVMDLTTHTTKPTNEKEYIEVLEVNLQGKISSRDELKDLVRTLQPEIEANLEGLKKLGVRITFDGKVVKAILHPNLPQKEFERRFLCSYTSNIEIASMFGPKTDGKGR